MEYSTSSQLPQIFNLTFNTSGPKQVSKVAAQLFSFLQADLAIY